MPDTTEVREHLNHHDALLVPGRVVDGEGGYWSLDLRMLLDTEEALILAADLEQIGYTDHAEQIRDAIHDTALTCTGCGRVGNTDDGIEMGGACQYADDETEPCNGKIVGVPVDVVVSP